MTITLNFIEALHGDSILISVLSSGAEVNILIDGGPRRAFNARPGYTGDGKLRVALDKIRVKRQAIDLLVMTHVDDDHIGGVIAAFEHPDYLSVMTKSVIFNSGKLIHEYFGTAPSPEKDIFGNFNGSKETSIKQGVTLEQLLDKKNIWVRRVFAQGDRHELCNIKFYFLSPDRKNLEALLQKWQKEKKSTNTKKDVNDYSKSYSELLDNDVFSSDCSVHNGSSLSFVVEIQEKKIAFLADAFAETIIEGLKKLGATRERPIKFDLVKISHHGSERNTSTELLQLINSDKFVISTDGSQHALPNKLTLARIHAVHPSATIYFNYPQLISKIYSAAEIQSLGEKIKPLRKDYLIE